MFVNRRVTTREELSSLPDGVILVSEGCAYQQSGINTWSTGGEDSWYCDVPLPATAVWMPDTPEDA